MQGPVGAADVGAEALVKVDPVADLDESGHARLSYQQAEAMFTAASGGATLTKNGPVDRTAGRIRG